MDGLLTDGTTAASQTNPFPEHLHENRTAAGRNLAAEYALAGGVDVMAEVYGDDRSNSWWGAGLRWAAAERFGVDASYAVPSKLTRIKLLTIGPKMGF